MSAEASDEATGAEPFVAPTERRARRRLVTRRAEQERNGPTSRWRQGLFRGEPTASVSSPLLPRRHWSSRLLHATGEGVANATAGIAATSLIAAWTIAGIAMDFPPWWLTCLYAVTASVTFVMVFVIQHTQARQVSAIQRKLDELVRVSDDADDALISVEQAPDETLQALADLNVADNANATTTS
jgi:low affinity Fe/Cu permease